jgi:poly [ADP-ribose] polymerase
MRIIKLVCVTADNSNKYYNMIQIDDSSWRCEWGRVGGSSQTKVYSMSQWDKKYKEKQKKGYTDITELVSVGKLTEEKELEIKNASPAVQTLIRFLQDQARQTIKKNYTVAVADVTQKQVDAAQEKLDALVKISQGKRITDRGAINTLLLEMYAIIPRKMKDTRKFVLQDGDGRTRLKEILSKEQDLLDVMAGQVQTHTTQADKEDNKDELDLEEAGLVITEATDEEKAEIAAKTDLDVRKIKKIFTVRHKATADRYEKAFAADPHANEHLFYHGSRNENWWSIINTGVKIKPANAVHTGSMFGPGAYWANKARKSIGYTSLRGSYWASGSSNKAYLGIFRVNLGRKWNLIGPRKSYEYWMSSLNKHKCNAKGYDSLFAKGGADLRNDEFITFEDARSTIKYLVELES